MQQKKIRELHGHTVRKRLLKAAVSCKAWRLPADWRLNQTFILLEEPFPVIGVLITDHNVR